LYLLSFQRLYDNLLIARIKIQKGLLAVNSLPQSDIVAKYRDETTMETLNQAKEAAYNVFVRTLELQQVHLLTTRKSKNSNWLPETY
jgi:Apoptosis antagonizing transcription factor